MRRSGLGALGALVLLGCGQVAQSPQSPRPPYAPGAAREAAGSAAQAVPASLVPRSGAAPLPHCLGQLRAEPWPFDGSAPRNRGAFGGWVAGRYVHIEEDREQAVWRAHIFDPRAGRWTKTELSTIDEPLRGRLRRSQLDRFHPSIAPLYVRATASRVVIAPQSSTPSMPEIVAGAVLDPATETWQAIEPENAVWRRSRSRMFPSDRHVLFWPSEATPHTHAGTEIALFDPAAMRWTRIPAPPIDTKRRSPLIALDDEHLVFFGGEERDQHNMASRSLSDGAVYSIRDRRWQLVPAGAPGRIASSAVLHNGLLLLFGGVDHSASRQLDHSGDTNTVRDIRALDVRRNQWIAVDHEWKSWQRWQPGFAGCTGCPPTATAGPRVFTGRRAVFDTQSRQLAIAPPFPAPPSWAALERGREDLEAHAIDERHLLLTSGSYGATGEAVLFDTIDRRACKMEIPKAAQELVAGSRHTVQDGAIYLWRDGHNVTETEKRDCPPGAPCMAPRTFERYQAAEAIILRVQRP